MKIVVCPDSFKGSLSAKEVALTIARSVKEKYPKIIVEEIPLADGGEGTAEILKSSTFPKVINVKAHDPLGRIINTRYYSNENGNNAFIESADVIGLPLLNNYERNPLTASSYGLGEIINIAIEKGGKEITVSLGGSATCDGGKGMLESLKMNLIHNIKFRILCDVTNPLLGEKGAVNIFAPQKGAKPEDLPLLEHRMEQFFLETVKNRICRKEDGKKEGAGAAGGLGFAFQTYLNAETLKGIDFILNEVNFDDKIKDADLIITGEGKIDSQSIMGKVISGVLERAKKFQIPVIVLGGIVEDKDLLLNKGFKAIYQISNPNLSLQENMSKPTALQNLKKTILSML